MLARLNSELQQQLKVRRRHGRLLLFRGSAEVHAGACCLPGPAGGEDLFGGPAGAAEAFLSSLAPPAHSAAPPPSHGPAAGRPV